MGDLSPRRMWRTSHFVSAGFFLFFVQYKLYTATELVNKHTSGAEECARKSVAICGANDAEVYVAILAAEFADSRTRVTGDRRHWFDTTLFACELHRTVLHYAFARVRLYICITEDAARVACIIEINLEAPVAGCRAIIYLNAC